MPSGLRPLTTLEVLDAAWLVLRRNWIMLYASSGVGTVPLALALMGYFYWLGTLVVGTEDSAFYSGTAVWAVGMAVGWTLNCVARGAVTAIALGEARGEGVSLHGAWRQALRTAPSGIFAGLVGFAATWLSSGCLIVPGLLLAVGWWVARPVTMTEDRPFAAALRRSWRLTEGYRGKALGLWLLSSGLWLFAALNLHLITHFLIGTVGATLGLDSGGLTPHLQWKNQAYTTVLLAFAFVLVDPLKTCIDALLYVDLRIRREGADLEERLRALRTGPVLLVLLLAFGCTAVPARAASVDDYANRVRSLRKQVEAAKKPAQVDPTSVATLRSQLIEMPGGQKLSVRNEWIRDGVDGWKTPEDKAALLRRLDALERSLGAPAAAPRRAPESAPTAPVDTQQALKGILAAPEFQPLADRGELRGLLKGVDFGKTKTWWQSFWDWVQQKLFSPPKAKAPTPTRPWKGGENVVWVLLGVMILVLLAMLVKWILERPEQGEARTAAKAGDAPPLEASATENALDHTVDEWELFAQQWLGRGDVRQAMRALYLATLVH
ncbi:MAG: hypothetical protein K0Q72_1754, partial [Armatimonadetes bacterium]|nr:hypothetical protein [Armatimonadota bacterium]